jgi:hypothetical protein
VYATGGVPVADCMLAQKLHIEANEENFRQVAHITHITNPAARRPLAPLPQ